MTPAMGAVFRAEHRENQAQMTVEPSAVASRKDLCAFIDALADEHRADPSAWENHDLPRVLEALAAWTRDSPATGPIADSLRLSSPTGRGWLSRCGPPLNMSEQEPAPVAG
jgi:hypothetical protein